MAENDRAPPATGATAATDATAATAAAARGEPAVRTLAMPADANPAGDIFGGWVLAQMDLAAGIRASLRARGRVATVAVDGMVFHRPVAVGDVVSCYATVIRVGRTSLTIEVEVHALRLASGQEVKVTEGHFTLVAIDDRGRPRPVPADPPPQT